MQGLTELLRKNGHYLAFALALVATLGSLDLSEILRLAPCVLCWYQRILMFPLVLVIGTGIVRRDRNLSYYALPLAILGWLTAAFHSLLQWGWLPESSAPCMAGVSCATKQLELWGFVTIPFMSLVAFSLIMLGLVYYAKGEKGGSRN